MVIASEDMRNWCGIEQVFRIERWVTKKGRTSYEVAYGIINLLSKHATARQIGVLVRNR